MKIIHMMKYLLFIITAWAAFTSCGSYTVSPKLRDDPVMQDPVFLPAENSNVIQSSVEDNVLDEYHPLAFDIPDHLIEITAENAHSLEKVETLLPEFLDYLEISTDGRIGARADLNGVEVLELDTGKILSQIPLEVPNCDYGMQRYSYLNRDGTYLAVVTTQEIQVWQVGGGLIHTSEYSMQYPNNRACGAEMPQLALSPDGHLLAIKGVSVSRSTAQEYFRIIDVLKNEILYEWDGSPDALHGDLIGFHALGFSADGKILQTFDASRFFAESGTAYESFRFWDLTDFKELDRQTIEVRTAFLPGETLFALQAGESLKILSRISGVVQATIIDSGCSNDFPCELFYSPQGLYALALDFNSNPQLFRGNLIGTRLTLWNLKTNRKVVDQNVLLRNLDGVRVTDEGLFLVVPVNSENGLTWWEPAYYFAGMLNIPNVGITFSPYHAGALTDSNCYQCSTCFLSWENQTFDCRPVFINQAGQSIALHLKEGHWQLYLDDPDTGSSGYPKELPQSIESDLQVRYLGLAQSPPILFYCLDKEMRQQSCFILNTEDDQVLAEHEDIYALRFSADGSQAAFIDREQNSLFLLDLQNQKQRRVAAYQARAVDINPVFLADTLDLLYMVQNQNNKNFFSLDWVNAVNGKVKRRLSLDETSLFQPSVLAFIEKELIAIGEKNGQIHLFNLEGKWIHSWQAHSSPLVGLIFDAHEKTIVSLDENGSIYFWGVQ